MGLDGNQFPSTRTARCTFVKNLDDTLTYGQWSSWGTEKMEQDGTNQVETTTKMVQSGTKNVAKNHQEQAPANRYTFSSSNNVYYACSSKYDNAGVYNEPVTCIRNITVYVTEPNYTQITYYRYRTKNTSDNTITKESNCDDSSLIAEGYTKIN